MIDLMYCDYVRPHVISCFVHKGMVKRQPEMKEHPGPIGLLQANRFIMSVSFIFEGDHVGYINREEP